MDKKQATLTFCGGAIGPTGSNFLFETEKKALLVDCGFFQGEKLNENKNDDPFLYEPKKIDILFITHAHLDHIGRIPKLIQEGFRGKIYSTPPTKEITELMLTDSLRVLTRQARETGGEAPYSEEDIITIMSLWDVCEYHEKIVVDDDTNVIFYDAGHILGSAMVEISYNGKKILFTGDLGNTPAPLLYDTETPQDISCLVMESVYGDRNHEDKKVRRELVRQAILQTVKNNGTLMIPVFSIERTQEMLFELNYLVEHNEIPLLPVFLDSPLAIKVTDIYKKYQHYFNDKTKDIIKSGDDIFNFPMLRFTKTRDESMVIADVDGPKVIMAGSGMSNGGRIVHHEKKYLEDPKNTLLLVGYQAVGTLGRRLQEGQKKVVINDKEVNVRAKIMTIHGYSAHKQSDDLLEFVATLAESDELKQVFVVLGEPRSSMYLSQKIRDYVGVTASVVKDGQSVDLLF
ncbi:MAG: MBL fold metallo-hydrolase [Candidatus Pacebacteria bacterium]|nr:MBL fold metallo-hydrolase [Candidatus Paceibacterota bacterium]